MARIVSKARQLRLEYQSKLGQVVTMQQVAESMGINRTTLNLIELGKTERADFDTLIKLCRFYSEALGREIGVGDILEYEPNKRQAPKLEAGIAS